MRTSGEIWQRYEKASPPFFQALETPRNFEKRLERSPASLFHAQNAIYFIVGAGWPAEVL